MGSCEGLRGHEEHGGFPRFPAIPETFITKRVRGHSSVTTPIFKLWPNDGIFLARELYLALRGTSMKAHIPA